MKKTILLSVMLLAAWRLSAQATDNITVKQSAVATHSLDNTHAKTTSLIFPAPVKSVDRGSEQVLVQKPAGVENVLKVKARDTQLEETNLTVITSDGKLYSFIVRYVEKPSSMTIQVNQLPSATSYVPVYKTAPVQFTHAKDNTETLKALTAKASVSKRNIKKVKTENNKVTASIVGLYTANDFFFYKLILNNASPISYQVASIRYFIRDSKKITRTATQEIELEPNYVTGSEQAVRTKEERLIMVVLPKHGIGKDKELAIEVVEKNGGRNLVCILNNKTLLKAKPVSLN